MKDRVYVISNLKAGIVKIGVSKHPEKRMKSLECQCGMKLFMWHQSKVLYNAYAVENLMHKHFAEYRTYGEWFVVGRKVAVIQLKRIIKQQDL